MTTNPEPECVRLKQGGAEHVARLIEGMTLEEQLQFWRNRTQALRQRQVEQRKMRSSEEPRIEVRRSIWLDTSSSQQRTR